MMRMRNEAAATDAAAVLTDTGSRSVSGNSLRRVIVPALAAVSPKRASGPWRSAGVTPR